MIVRITMDVVKIEREVDIMCLEQYLTDHNGSVQFSHSVVSDLL